MTRAHLDKQPHEVAAMFDGVARRYDLTNAVLSAGQARAWRAAVLHAVDPRRGHRVLDLAAGTGTSSEPLRRAGATVVPVDFSLGMLRTGRRRLPHLPFVAGDALRLPFADRSFDAVTISFGLRNVADVDAALREMLRVTRPGGRLVVCEFASPTWRPMRTAYLEYVLRALPAIARAVSSNPDAYVYLAESIRAWPDQPALAARIAGAGWADVEWRDLTGGIVALHRATRPRHDPGLAGNHDSAPDTEGRTAMGTDDKTRNKVEEISGQAKEQIGTATGDKDLQAEGKTDQSKANLKQAGEKIKDAFKS